VSGELVLGVITATLFSKHCNCRVDYGHSAAKIAPVAGGLPGISMLHHIKEH